MIIEPVDALLALVDGSGIRKHVAEKLRIAHDHWGVVENEDLVIWAPDWFWEAYCPLVASTRKAKGG